MRGQSVQIESYKYGEGFPDLTWSLPRITEKLSFQPTKTMISIKEKVLSRKLYVNEEKQKRLQPKGKYNGRN